MVVYDLAKSMSRTVKDKQENGESKTAFDDYRLVKNLLVEEFLTFTNKF